MKKHLLVTLFLTFILSSAFAEVLPTSLRVTVRDALGNVVKDATVTVYTSEEDYNNKENPVTEPVITNQKGEARFKDLQPVSYYIDVRKGDLTNEDGGVQIGRLDKGRINKATIIIQ